jgi:hypothetical protein
MPETSYPQLREASHLRRGLFVAALGQKSRSFCFGSQRKCHNAFFPAFFAFTHRALAATDSLLFPSALMVRFFLPAPDATRRGASLVPVRALIAATTRSRCCVNSSTIWLVKVYPCPTCGGIIQVVQMDFRFAARYMPTLR